MAVPLAAAELAAGCAGDRQLGRHEFALANLPPLTRHLHVVDGFGPDERDTRSVAASWSAVWCWPRQGHRAVPHLQRIATEVWKLPQRVVKYVPNGIDLARFALVPEPPRQIPRDRHRRRLAAGKEYRPPDPGRRNRRAREPQRAAAPPRHRRRRAERASLTALAAQHNIADR